MLDSPLTAWKNNVLKIMALGTLIRLLLALLSNGSNDARLWHLFAQHTWETGLISGYQDIYYLNHPPLPIYWAQTAYLLGVGKGWMFTVIFKLPVIAADAGSCWLAAQLAERLGGPGAGLSAAAAVALSPIGILISGFHCNTDCIYAFFVLLCAMLIRERRLFFAGLALGAAINTKLIPLIFVPAAFSFCRSRDDLKRLTFGLLLAVIPFTPLLLHGSLLKHNMLQYSSNEDRWGIIGFLLELDELKAGHLIAPALKGLYVNFGRYGIIALVLALSAFCYWFGRWSAPRLFLLISAVFLIFAPGFGLQYLVLPLPLLAAIDPLAAWTYSIYSGLLAGIAYALWWRFQFPFQSIFYGPLPRPAAIFGYAAWGALMQVTAKLLYRPDRDAPASR